MSKLLINDSPLIVLPRLALEIGPFEAMMLQQIHFLSSIPKSGKYIDGYHWIWNTYEEWHESYFPFLGIRTIQRIIHKLKKLNLIVTCRHNQKFNDQTLYYRVNTEEIDKLEAKLNAADTAKLAISDTAKLTTSRHAANLASSLSETQRLPPKSGAGLTPSKRERGRSANASQLSSHSGVDVWTLEESARIEQEAKYKDLISRNGTKTGLAVWNAITLKATVIKYLSLLANADRVLLYAIEYAADHAITQNWNASDAAGIAVARIKSYDGRKLPEFDLCPDFGEVRPAFLKHIW